jgi:hypothetical protein
MSHNFFNATVSCTINHSVPSLFILFVANSSFFPLLLMKFKSFPTKDVGGMEKKEEKNLYYMALKLRRRKNWFHNTDALEKFYALQGRKWKMCL